MSGIMLFPSLSLYFYFYLCICFYLCFCVRVCVCVFSKVYKINKKDIIQILFSRYLCLAVSLAGKRLRNMETIWLNHQTFKHVVIKLPPP